MPVSSGPATGVHAIAKAQTAMRPHMPAEEATERQNRRPGPSGPGSAAAQAEVTAMAMPTANQISIGGSVPANQNAGRG
jgi:hypothetical protein